MGAGQCRVTTTTTTAPQTTTIPDDRCPAKRLYGEHSAATALLRCFRDSVLSRTAEGQEIIKLYYQWSPVIAQAMEEDAGLEEWIQETIDSVLPIIEREVAQPCVQNNLRH